MLRGIKKHLTAVALAGFVLLSAGSVSADVPDMTRYEAAGITAERFPAEIALKSLQEKAPDGGELVKIGYYELQLSADRQLSTGNRERISDINGLNYQLACKELDRFGDKAREALGNSWMRAMLPFYTEHIPTVVKADAGGLSILVLSNSWLGGAHPSYSYGGMNFAADGAVLRAEDICTDVEALCRALKDKLKMIGFAEYCFDIEKSFREYAAGGGRDLVFVRDDEAVYFYFSPYRIAPYAAGYSVARLRYDDYPELLRRI